MVWKGNAPMPSCNLTHQAEISDAIERLRGRGRAAATALAEELGLKELCTVLHAMRRWYSYNCWNAAKKIIPFRDELRAAMDLDPDDAIGVYRGIRVPWTSALAEVDVGDVLQLPRERGAGNARNGGCSSWSLQRKYADRFSGKQPGKVGLVIKLLDPKSSKPFIAPPSRSASWFNTLYRNTMGASFRFNEQEYALYGERQLVQIVAVKR